MHVFTDLPDMLTALEISSSLSCMLWESFLGIISAENLETVFPDMSVTFPGYLVIRCKRKDSSQNVFHWVVVIFQSAKEIIFFSSDGCAPRDFLHVKEFLDSYISKHGAKVKFLDKRIQAIRDKTCGKYCVAIVLLLSLGLPYQIVFNLFSNVNFRHNNVVANTLYNYAKSKYDPTINADIIKIIHDLYKITDCSRKNCHESNCEACFFATSYPTLKINL
jgi:hypothetical protein